MIQLAFVLAGLYSATGHCNPAPAPPALPAEVLTLDKIAQELRSPLTQKISDMRRTYRVQESVAGSELLFLNNSGKQVAILTFRKELSPQKNRRMEIVRLSKHDGRMLFEEKVFTEGTHLELSPAAAKIFFQGEAQYGLAENETFKNVVISMDGKEVYGFRSTRRPLEEGAGTVLNTDIHYGSSKTLVLRDSWLHDGSKRVVDYSIAQSFASISVFDMTFSTTTSPDRFAITVLKPPRHVVENYRFFRNGNEILGLNHFLEEFNPKILDRYVTRGIVGPMTQAVDHYFPETVRLKNLAATGKFLDELVNLRNQVEQAKSNPSMLITISNRINSFISAIQEGTLTIIDKRPEEK